MSLSAAGAAAAAKTVVTPVYRKAGRYRVDLVATDAAGHTALVSRTSVRIRR